MPADWLKLTTHRLDIYTEKLAKTQFLEQFEALYATNNADAAALLKLPTAFDYIRLGHPLSCILEWAIARFNETPADNVISFSSKTMPVLAVLRKNALDNKKTRIVYAGELPLSLDIEVLRKVYGYDFVLEPVDSADDITSFGGSTILLSTHTGDYNYTLPASVDFLVSIHPALGSVLLVNGEQNESYIPAIQHVRRRESIAMTPANCDVLLSQLIEKPAVSEAISNHEASKDSVATSIRNITATTLKPLIGSSGLSVQYAIMMGLIHDAVDNHPGKDIKIIIPPNCYGGTNDQARRVAACLDQVEVLDLPVDGGEDMVQGIDTVLAEVASQDAVPYIIAEIPTNPRVEVPDLQRLKAVLEQMRMTKDGKAAITPVFILDQTFCPNVHFLSEGDTLSTVRTISYSSGSKFPSGGLCTAGYCVGNDLAADLMEKVDLHLRLCDNEATQLQTAILAKQLPSMQERIKAAYQNTRSFVDFIGQTLPDAKINFVSEELAAAGFTPSVFSLDLPTRGETAEEKETYKRALNLKLINRMITEIPTESKFCVSYGQLKGCYWTVPATSTQGTTKEGDKDYIVRVALSPDMDLARHKEVFAGFVGEVLNEPVPA